MSTKPDKIPPDEVIREIRLQAELDRVNALSDEELLADLDASGVRIPTPDELRGKWARGAAGAGELPAAKVEERGAAVVPIDRAVRRAAVGTPKRARRDGWLPLSAAGGAVAVAAGVLLWVARPGIEVISADNRDAGVKQVPPSREAAERALALREEAKEACADGRFAECAGALDGAGELDPAGESTPGVVALRQAIAAGAGDGGKALTPPTRRREK